MSQVNCMNLYSQAWVQVPWPSQGQIGKLFIWKKVLFLGCQIDSMMQKMSSIIYGQLLDVSISKNCCH